MNINSTVELSFDLTKRNNALTVTAKQCDDKTRSVTVKLTQGGKSFRSPENASITLCGTKPDSTVFELLPTDSSDNSYTFFLTDYVLSAEGRIRCEVKCSWSDGDEVRVCSTEIFYINNLASAITPGNANIRCELQSVERATAAALGAAEVAAKTAEDILEAKRNGEFDGRSPVLGEDYWTETDKAQIIEETLAAVSQDGVPDYWEEHLSDRINTVKDLQNRGGKDCFSFVVMTDMHYPKNLGKISPLIAKRILDKCDIKYALCLGDIQTRGCHATKSLLLAENEEIEKMLSPIRSRLLQTEGNHDGAYGFYDRDGDTVFNNVDGNGNTKEPSERETYVSNLTPAEMYNTIYRKVGLIGDVHFDESGSGYYVDDNASKVRYIVLNTNYNDYELQSDGTAKYPKMWIFRFAQKQFDLVTEALSSIPSDSYSVVVAGHCPLWQEIGDRDVMIGVLNAYKNKTTFSGSYSGTASGGAAYTNLADINSGDWKTDYRISSSGLTAQSGKTVSNYIPCKKGDIVRIKGVDFVDNADRYIVYKSDRTDYIDSQYVNYPSEGVIASFEKVGDVYEISLADNNNIAYIRFAFTTPSNPEDVIITVNEEIAETALGYDAVSVNADFSDAKGTLVGYFAGHVHLDRHTTNHGFPIITTRCDAQEENTEDLYNERVSGTVTEQSFDVFTVDKSSKTVYATKIGAGEDRIISY